MSRARRDRADEMSPALFCRHLGQLVDELARVEPDCGSDVEELDDIDPALTCLDAGDERLMTPECLSHLDLCHPGPLAIADEELGETRLPG